MMKRSMPVAGLLMAAGVQAGELMIEVDGKGMAGNPIRIAIYSADAPEQFPSGEKFFRGVVREATAEHLTVIVPDLPAGKYAVAAYADSNRNGKLDRNFLGVPKEPYGFSNDARGTFGPPDFSAAAFELGDGRTSISIHLR